MERGDDALSKSGGVGHDKGVWLANCSLTKQVGYSATTEYSK